jgi:hypothetical protein
MGPGQPDILSLKAASGSLESEVKRVRGGGGAYLFFQCEYIFYSCTWGMCIEIIDYRLYQEYA